jgi:hypothetical protein
MSTYCGNPGLKDKRIKDRNSENLSQISYLMANNLLDLMIAH